MSYLLCNPLRVDRPCKATVVYSLVPKISTCTVSFYMTNKSNHKRPVLYNSCTVLLSTSDTVMPMHTANLSPIAIGCIIR